MSNTIHQIDAFTDAAFGGNPAAVMLLDAPAESAWMQNVALEMNLSETAFLEVRDDGYGLRWFTPAHEVDLCGHATLASAHFLWCERHLAEDATARFHTRSGVLSAERDGDWIVLDFPALTSQATDIPDGLAAALGAEPVSVVNSAYDILAELDSEAAVRGLAPNFVALKPFSERGVIVTAEGDGEYDFVSRFFAPNYRVDEDPVTGSAHCVLAPYWGARLGRTAMTAYQASERGGVVRVETVGTRVSLAGQAVTVMKGELV
jgi:PhzF family phenazine biosynthesis protein